MILDIVKSFTIEPLRQWWRFLPLRVVLDVVALALAAVLCALIFFGHGDGGFLYLLFLPGVLSLAGRGRSAFLGVATLCIPLVLGVPLLGRIPDNLLGLVVFPVVFGWIASWIFAVRGIRKLLVNRKRDRGLRAVRMLYVASINVRAARTLRGKNRAYSSA
jgi:hypothetical protein